MLNLEITVTSARAWACRGLKTSLAGGLAESCALLSRLGPEPRVSVNAGSEEHAANPAAVSASSSYLLNHGTGKTYTDIPEVTGTSPAWEKNSVTAFAPCADTARC